MDVKLVLLMNFAIVANCQSTISSRNYAKYEHELFEDIKSEMESIRQLLVNTQKAAVSIKTQAILEMKSEIQEIRQIAIQQQYWSRNQQRKTECPFGFDYLPEAGSCYTIIFEEMTWNNATERCRGIMPGVHLAAITSQEESNAVTRYLQSQFSKTTKRWSSAISWCSRGYLVWISGQKRNQSRCDTPFFWKPLNGIEISFNFTNWHRANKEPNCAGEEACVHIVSCNGHATWNDYNCNLLSFPLCEI